MTQPVETKTAAGGFVGILTYILVTFIPAFRTGLPPALATLLPVVVGILAAWLAPHTARPGEPDADPSRVVAAVKGEVARVKGELGNALWSDLSRALADALDKLHDVATQTAAAPQATQSAPAPAPSPSPAPSAAVPPAAELAAPIPANGPAEPDTSTINAIIADRPESTVPA